MDIVEIADQLVDAASSCGQAVIRIDDSTPVDALRAEVRAAAAARGLQIRTGIVDDVLAVVRADAPLWGEPASEMRKKLSAPTACNVVA